jgi:hypothetical protein
MLANLKTQFYSLIKGLGYNITDNAEYKENFPWLMLRTNGYRTLNSFNINMSSAVLVLDIFSKYPGEKEIIEIVENIGAHLDEIKNANPDVMFAYQKTLKILDDKSTGPVRKHGVVVYEFLMGYGIAPIEEVPEVEPEN